ncbi:EXS family-domain-containing protein [Gilbertella persicaria]|uniref:EXS family-domain-containing protein n=1 Tax=Gilbertella persicaria TaxID=101096 RepID=UPI00221F4E78|nr:EXS family-domain-containing protein [Gilbertella persicaria]KAI8087824.1 EXS family-domain-containing protein [Gilbertella persicaria]
MEGEGTLLPITYRPIVLFSIGVLGWALDLFILQKCGIDPISLLQLHQTDKHIPLHQPIFFLSGILGAISCASLALFWHLKSPSIAVLPYLLALLLLIWPGRSFYRKERLRFTRALRRVLSLNIFSPVFFSDIILADMLTSFSNVFGDLFIASCVFVAGYNSSFFMDNTENIYYRDIAVPLLISTPYLIRLKQCIAEYIESKEKRHVFNALKYASSLPVVIFSAVQRKAAIYITETGSVPHHWYLKEDTIFRFWIMFVFINSMYSFWWDISMDWNLISVQLDPTQVQEQPTLKHPKVIRHQPQTSTPIVHFRRQLYFSQPFWYVLSIFFDFLLRITWSLKLSSHIYLRKLDGSIFLMELLEVFRRWMWVIFRLESEWVKKVYNSLPNAAFENLRMDLLDRRSSGTLSPIVEEEDP